MATNHASTSIPIPAQPRPDPPSPPTNATSPPNKRDLVSWWKGFKRNTKKDEEKVQPPVGIFGVPLGESIRYANVAISLTNEKGESYIYGYVPIVVAKCGVLLKEKATDVEGIFRLSGSAKRIKELQVIFDSPDRYGKGLDWAGYTVHDAANILRRYLNQLPQPIIPLDFYERARDPIRGHQEQAVGDSEAVHTQATNEFDRESAIIAYQKLITELPPLNRQLLLYILDLLAVFASKSEQNRMPSANLAAIFQPGLLSHPDHDMSPDEYRLSQNVLIFLIEHQDHFLVGMSGTAADEKTVQEVQRGVQPQPSSPAARRTVGLGRSASNASGGADSLRRAGGALRRNLSISSRQSKGSSNAPSPGSPAGSPLVGGSGVQRSNTVPSQRSPRPASNRFANVNGGSESPKSPAPVAAEPAVLDDQPPGPITPLQMPAEHSTATSSGSPAITAERSPALKSVPEIAPHVASPHQHSSEGFSLRPADTGVVTTITSSGTPVKERKSFFSKSPTDGERRDGRGPNKLRKKHRTTSTSNNVSAQSSTHSLPGHQDASGNAHGQFDGSTPLPPIISNTDASPVTEEAPQLADIDHVSAFHVSQGGSRAASPAIKPARSPVASIRSRTSRQGSKLGDSAMAEKSEVSLSGVDMPKKSETFNSQHTANTDVSAPLGAHASSNDSTPSKDKDKEATKEGEEREKKGPIGWFKAKVAHAKEEREERKAEREAEKERAKSPAAGRKDPASSQSNLDAVTPEPTSKPSPKVGEESRSPETSAASET